MIIFFNFWILYFIAILLFSCHYIFQPKPGFESRPDRILASTRYLKVTSCLLHGLGEPYENKYSAQVKWTRLWHVLEASEATYYETKENTGCYHDCGPHGSCRCAICVAGGNKNKCMPPNCPECNSDVYFYYVLFKALLIFFVVQLMISTIHIVLIFKSRYRYQLQRTGCNCCLCLPHYNCTYPKGNARFRCSLPTWRRCLCLGMPPLVHFIFCLICLCVLSALSVIWFEEPMKIVNAVLKEELNPSDHLMVTAVLETTWRTDFRWC